MTTKFSTKASAAAAILVTLGLALSATSLPTPEAATASASGDQPLILEPVVELTPDTDPTDPAVREEIEEYVEERTRDLADAAAENQESPTDRANSTQGGFSVTYSGSNGGFTPTTSQRTAIQKAVNSWATALTTSAGPIEVEVTWRNFGSSNILGSAGPSALYSGGPQGYETTAARNTRLGNDVNPSGPEIVVHLNSTANWYAGSGSPSFSQMDLESVMLHELGHGLGFLGLGSPSSIPSTGSAYDNQVTYNGAPYLNNANPAATLTSNNNRLQVDTSDTYRYRVHSPSTWIQGTSLSHFDEATYPDGSAGVLMTPTIIGGDTHRSLDGPVLGVMAQIGWELDAPISVPTIVSINTSGNPVVVDWVGNYGSYGYIPDAYRVDVLNGTRVIATTTTPASTTVASIPNLPFGTFTFRVTPVDNTTSGSVDGTPSSRSASILQTPSAVSYVDLDGIGSTQTISWPAAGGNPTSYIVETSTDGVRWTRIGTPTTTSMRYRFNPGTYQVRVTAVNSKGQGPANTSIFVPIGSDYIRPAPLDHRIFRLYEAAFLRYPDQSGFTNWRLQHAQRTSLETIANGFTNSAEFTNRYGTLSNDRFVERLYLNVFNRPVDSAGRATWVGLLNNGATRGNVVIGLSNSAEFVSTTKTVTPSSTTNGSIYRLYMAYFKRLPDQGGFDDWVAQRNAGRSLDSISEQFATAPEFQQTYGSLSDAEFVDLLYLNVLARQADAGGRADWIAQLRAGSTRGEVMTGFSESAEFILATGSAP